MSQRQRRYFPVDGGAGAHLLEALAWQSSSLQRVDSPRQADLLLVIEPITATLAPSVAEVARALPRPAQALLISTLDPTPSQQRNVVRGEDLFPGARRAPSPAADDLLAAALDPSAWPELAVNDAFSFEPTTISLPATEDLELATELAVFSLGPLQPCTAGPLRLWLVCDGEQVLSCRVEGGYARRGIAEAMLEASWREGLRLASQLDPLAPLAGQLAYVRAIESLQRWDTPDATASARATALKLEVAQNALWWAARFFRLLDSAPLARHTADLAARLDTLAALVLPIGPQRLRLPAGALLRGRRICGMASGSRWVC